MTKLFNCPLFNYNFTNTEIRLNKWKIVDNSFRSWTYKRKILNKLLKGNNSC